MKRRPLIHPIDLSEMLACGCYPASLKWRKRLWNRRQRQAGKKRAREEA